MSSRSLVAPLSFLLMVSAGPAPSSARPEAPPEWGPTRTLTASGQVDPTSIDLAVGPGGLAAAVWARGHLVLAAVRPAHRGWGRPVVLGRRLGLEWLEPPQVAIDGRGVVTVVWTGGRRYFGDRLLARSKSAGAPWGPRVQLSRTLPGQPYDEIWGPEIAVNRQGDAVVAWGWTRDDSYMATRTGSTYRPAGGHWSAPVVVSDVDLLSVTLDRRGNVMMYVATGRYDNAVSVLRRVVDRGWLKRRPLLPRRALDSWMFDAAGNARGDQVIIFAKEGSGEPRVWARSKPSHGRWSEKARIGEGAAFAVAVDDRGRATAVLSPDYAAGPVTVVSAGRLGVWSRPTTVSLRDGVVRGVTVAANEAGDRVVAWVTDPDGPAGPALWACYGDASGALGSAVRLTGARTHGLDLPVSAVRGAGQAVVAWTSSRGDEPDKWRRLRLRQTR